MNNKIAVLMLIIGLSVIMMPNTVNADSNWGILADEVYGEKIRPLPYVIDYNSTTKVARIKMFEYGITEEDVKGLEIIELLFSADCNPDSISAVYVNETNAIDMIYIHPEYPDLIYEGYHFWMEGDSKYYDAVYLLAFIYTDPDNKTFTDLDTYLTQDPLMWYNKTWIGGPNDTSSMTYNPEEYSLLSSIDEKTFTPSSNPGLYVDIAFNESIPPTTTTTTTDVPSDLIFLVGVPPSFAALVILVLYVRQKKKE